MARPLTPLGELGGKISEALAEDAGSRERAIEEARHQFAARALPPAPKSRASFVPVFAFTSAAAAIALVGWLVFGRGPAPLRFNVDGAAGVAQTWLAAPSARPLVVSFSDGTVLDVEPSSRARVVDVSQNGADIALESGQVHARVVHTGQSAWRLIAGPFAVRVTGTRFDVRWDPAAQQFSLAVLEGSVVVSGSVVGSERPVRAGEKLLASVAQGRLELITAEMAAAAAKQPAPATRADEPGGTASPDAEPAGAASEASANGAGPSWRDFAKKGDLRKAFAAAEARGFSGVCDGASSSELLLLGDAARLSGRSDRATEALLTLRRRYPNDPRRAAAAFALGKVAFDHRRAFGQAAEWFATCMREQPSGPLAREAAGRRLEALHSAGSASEAEVAARDYLKRYPDGPHADVARSLLK
jgi:TolA-binding protein